jgi:hypothetical protein
MLVSACPKRLELLIRRVESPRGHIGVKQSQHSGYRRAQMKWHEALFRKMLDGGWQ